MNATTDQAAAANFLILDDYIELELMPYAEGLAARIACDRNGDAQACDWLEGRDDARR